MVELCTYVIGNTCRSSSQPASFVYSENTRQIFVYRVRNAEEVVMSYYMEQMLYIGFSHRCIHPISQHMMHIGCRSTTNGIINQCIHRESQYSGQSHTIKNNSCRIHCNTVLPTQNENRVLKKKKTSLH